MLINNKHFENGVVKIYKDRERAFNYEDANSVEQVDGAGVEEVAAKRALINQLKRSADDFKKADKLNLSIVLATTFSQQT